MCWGVYSVVGGSGVRGGRASGGKALKSHRDSVGGRYSGELAPGILAAATLAASASFTIFTYSSSSCSFASAPFDRLVIS